jgi:hypothetical protein
MYIDSPKATHRGVVPTGKIVQATKQSLLNNNWTHIPIFHKGNFLLLANLKMPTRLERRLYADMNWNLIIVPPVVFGLFCAK